MEHQQRTFVVGDVHGCREPLQRALCANGLIDDGGDWAAGDTHLWFLGDFVDRGPDGIGVIDLVMRLHAQAAAAGGQVQTLLGNHEVLLLGARRFGDQAVPGNNGRRSFERSWLVNGGQLGDLEGLTDEHIGWLTSRPVVAHAADHLLLHSDSVAYLDWGTDVGEISAAVQDILAGDDLEQWWDLWRKLTTRYAFRGPDGPEVAALMLSRLGGSRIVHGHSVIADQQGIAPEEVTEPYAYAGGRVLGVDGGVFVGGPCLVVALP